jgi:hypothetical protein
MVIFTILFLPIHKHGRSFHLVRCSLISFFEDFKFLLNRSFTCLVRVTPRYSILFVTILKDAISLISLSAHLSFDYRKATGRAWWCTPLIPALGRQRQADFWVRGQPGLQSEFQDSPGYTKKSCLRKKKKNERLLVFSLGFLWGWSMQERHRPQTQQSFLYTVPSGLHPQPEAELNLGPLCPFPASGELASMECSDPLDSGGSWSARSADRD